MKRLAVVTAMSCGAVAQDSGKGIQVKVATRDGESFLYRESHALLIGNSEYDDPGWSDLGRVPEELEALKLQLAAQGFGIYRGKVHLNQKKADLLDLIEDFVTDHGVGDSAVENRLLIFYSGHGASKGDQGFLVPVDAPGAQANPEGFRKSAIEMSRVESWARRMDSKHALFAFDSCFSGAVFTRKGETGVPPHITMKAALPARQFLTAGSKDETVPALSYFTPYFVRGIAGEADMGDKDGYVTAGELSEYLTSKVAKSPAGNHVQFGELSHPYDQGDLVFVGAGAAMPASTGVSIPAAPSTPSTKGPFTNTLGMKFVPVPGTDILFSVWETRVQDFAAYAEANPKATLTWKNQTINGHTQGPDDPVTMVSWEDANAFCAWLSQKEGMTYRLPTDHEWSMAAGIGDRENPAASPKEKTMKIDGAYPWGTDWPPAGNAANLNGQESPGFKLEGYRDGFAFTAPVGSFKPNSLGIHDLSGNLMEWCENAFDSANPSGRVLRGGAWNDYMPANLLSSARGYLGQDWRLSHIGFRCVLETGPGK